MTELPDRLLRDALDDTALTPSTACLDAGTLAAWADGTLTRGERTSMETHAAECARCLALLAAMTRTEPPSIAPPWWRRSPIAWLLPLAAVTAGLVIVVRLALLEQRASSLPAAVPVATPAPPLVNVARATPAPAQPPETSVASKAPARTRRQKPQPVAPSGSAAPAAAEAARDTAAQAPAAAPVQTPPLTREVATSVADAQLAAGRSGGRGGARAFAQTAMKAAAPLAPIVIASPDRDSQWRIVGGTVEHTADGGATWQPQSIGVVAPIRAGAAPDARVCWVAGSGGVVLRTTDGSTWTRLPFPEPADLIAIQASDASHASVTTATGVRFTTSDGAATWVRQ